MKLRGTTPAFDEILEHETRAARQWLDIDMHVAELAVAARLPLVTAMLPGGLLDRLFIRHARHMRGDFEAVFAGEFFDRDFQMDFALARERHLLQFGVLLEMQGRVFLLQFVDGGGELHPSLRSVVSMAMA